MADVPAEGAVPPVVVPAVVVHPDIHTVLAICGFANVVDHTSIINNEGFQLIVVFGILEDKDMFEMVKCLGNHTVAAGRVNVGAIQVKKLQALCYWLCDQQKH
jgi:folylpolyglutamate synthase/dihydropteroate synthase